VLHELSLLFHFIGFGLLMTTTVAGLFLHLQYRKVQDIRSKMLLLRALKPIGLLSPVAMGIMLITGIINMSEIGVGIFTLGWLTAKIGFFAIAIVSGVLFSMKSRKRAALAQKIVSGTAPPYAEEMLDELDKQLLLFYVVMPLLLLVIVYLSVWGRLGIQ